LIHLSIIIPSYKNAVILDNNLPYLITNLSKCDFTNEIIIVDDGSDDNGKTKDIASKYNCKFILSETNKGKGNAVRLGMISATGKYRIFTDADIPYEFENITNMLYYLDFKEFEMVVGDRTLENSKYFSEITVSRNLGSKIFSFIVGRFIAGGQFDTQCGLKGFRDYIAKDLFSVSKINGFTLDVELFYIAYKRNYDIKCIPVALRSNEGNSVNVFVHGIKMLFDLPKIIFNFYTKKYTKKNG